MWYVIITSIISIIVAILALQNGDFTPVNFVFWEFDIPLICVILISFLAGALVSSVVLMYSKFKHFLSDFKNNQEIKRLNKEIEGLQKNIALLTEPSKTVEIKADDVKIEDAKTVSPNEFEKAELK